MKLKKKSAVTETRRLMNRETAFFALRSCRVRVCSWTQLPPYLCRWFSMIGVCRRTSGWHALLLTHFFPATGQIMGFTLETGIFCLVPDRKIPVGYCFGCCCFIFGTSPGYEMGDDKSEEAANRRRGLLKKVCSQERAVTVVDDYSWSDSTSVRKPILYETECPCPFCLVPRHVIGTQQSHFVSMALTYWYHYAPLISPHGNRVRVIGLKMVSVPIMSRSLNSSLFTLHSSLFTLNLEPWTLNLEPSTLNLEPWTLNLEPWTLNLEPWALSLEPWALPWT